MSNTYLGKRRAAGLLKSAPVSKELASKAKKKRKLSKPQKEKKKKQASILDFFKKGENEGQVQKTVWQRLLQHELLDYRFCLHREQKL